MSAGAAAVRPEGPADALVARYEDLRPGSSTGTGAGSRWGLALLRAARARCVDHDWAAGARRPAVAPHPEVARRLPDAHQADVVRVLATMTTL